MCVNPRHSNEKEETKKKEIWMNIENGQQVFDEMKMRKMEFWGFSLEHEKQCNEIVE